VHEDEARLVAQLQRLDEVLTRAAELGNGAAERRMARAFEGGEDVGDREFAALLDAEQGLGVGRDGDGAVVVPGERRGAASPAAVQPIGESSPGRMPSCASAGDAASNAGSAAVKRRIRLERTILKGLTAIPFEKTG
jgi:hypothetical protein